MLIHADRLLHPDGTLAEGWVRVAGEVIGEVGRGPAPAPPDRSVALLSPGFVDVHCHGGGGASFTSGTAEEAARAASAHHRCGTTTVLASLVSQPVEQLADRLQLLRDLSRDEVIAGVHLEGPWLSPLHRGAHDPAALVDPTPPDLERVVEAGGGSLRMVTLAPELPGALTATEHLVAAGVTVAVGHTDADARTTLAAFDAGASVVTHLFNAMRPVHHRTPGPVPVALADPRVSVELIADGVHVDARVLAMAARAATGGFLLVSDAMAAAGAEDGDYLLGDVAVEVRDGVARVAATGAIAGSTLTLLDAVRHAVTAGLPLETVLVAACQAPAGRLGLEDRGRIAAGARADLVVLDDDLALRGVLRSGAWIA